MVKHIERLRKGDTVKVRVSLAGTGVPREEGLRKGSVGLIQKENQDGTYQVEFRYAGNYITFKREELKKTRHKHITRDCYGFVVIR